jgi:hypothetical protein
VALAIAIGLTALSQERAAAPQRSSAANTPGEQQKNAASASKDNSGDQVTKPAGGKGTTVIGCLSGPDKDGRYVLTSMQHRSGIQVLGAGDLKGDSGSKVKLTGAWEANPERPQVKEARRFHVTAAEVLSQNCKAPSATTPVSKEKQREQKQKSNPGDQTNPKQ